MTNITIGARGSKLSLAYVEKVKELLLQLLLVGFNLQ